MILSASLFYALSCFGMLRYTSAQSFQYLFNDSLPDVALTPACAAALTSNISCDPSVTYFQAAEYYDPTGLRQVCTKDCQTGIQNYYSSLTTNCQGLMYNDTESTYLPIDSIGSRLEYIYSLVCLQDSGRFCNYVAYEASLQADVNASAPLGQPNGTAVASPCDGCFVKQLQLQAGSPFGGGSELAAAYSSLTSSCGVAGMPIKTTAISSSMVSPTPNPISTCLGETYIVASNDTCRSIAQSQGISIGWLVSDNNLNAYCAGFDATGSLCIQNTCATYTIKVNDTCTTIAKANNITSAQIISWNPTLNSACNNIAYSINDPICISKPGVPYTSPNMTIPVATSFSTAAPAPTDIAEDTTRRCGEFYQVQEGDYCNLVCLKFNIKLDDFLFLNPSVNASCTNLYAHESYCVAPVGSLSNYPGHPGYVAPINASVASAWLSAPKATYLPPVLNITDNAPLASGTRSDCWSFMNGEMLQLPINGTVYQSTCQFVASTYDITLDQLRNWNPSLNTNSTTCAFQTGVRYCLLPYKPTTTTSTTPTQTAFGDMIRPGTWTNCTAYFDVDFSWTCQRVLDNFGLTIAQFSTWNPEVGRQCENLWENYSYCVSLNLTLDEAAGSDQSGGGTTNSTPVATSSMSTASTGPVIPSPTQPGSIMSSCNTYKQAMKGDYCYIFARNNGITVDQLAAWNTVLGAGGKDCGSQFWINYWYCVGVA
ncbi:hypothetical protein F5Y03DRAFT_401258 [Xylaria venustula]|nr:hypothetical protein F5Y03DRAFT_401258 [Xylaria venustula]